MSIRTLIAAILLLSSVAACGGSSGGGGGGTGATLTGTVASFTASLDVEKKSFFARLKDLILPQADAAVAGVTVSIGSLSTTSGADGSFTLSDIPTGNQTVVFAEGGSSANYALEGVAENETFTLSTVQVDGTVITTEHTGTWEGTIYSSDIAMTLPLTMTIGANTNAFTGQANNNMGDVWDLVGTENGTSVSGRATVVEGPCVGDYGDFTGTFNGDMLSGTYTSPGGVCNPSDGTWELTKT